MYLGVFLLLLLLVGWTVRTLLDKTSLPGWAVLLFMALISAAAAFLLYWGAIVLSVFLFHLRDPITW